ncbi:MAG: class I SAM-dependent methyltransferase [Alphaproteobacteria bacterium]|nr:class I SAM-dependent methyltransferase [Alphaproteobacteria bacterium]
MYVKPIIDVVDADLSLFAKPAARLLDLPDRPGFERAMAFFDDYPARGLSDTKSSAFMHCLVRALQPKLFVEIGTYYAGMTEVVARAMLTNGNNGLLLTIDPFGNHRVPGILKSWPHELSRLVSYMPLDSMGFYTEVDTIKSTVDVCFIDGNHLYEYVFYDLNSMAQRMRPGGIVVMDDYSQPGVFWATKHFLDLNPGWREISGVFDDFDPNAPFTSIRPTVPGTGFLVLAAPNTIEIGDGPSVFEYSEYRETAISGYRLNLGPGNVAGRLHALVYLRSFFDDGSLGDPEQLEIVTSTEISGEDGEQSVLFDTPLATNYDRSLTKREVEINLIWAPSDGRTRLRLLQQPDPIMLN